MIVRFYFDDKLIKEVMLTTIPIVGDSVVINQETYRIHDVIYNFDENYFVRIELM